MVQTLDLIELRSRSRTSFHDAMRSPMANRLQASQGLYQSTHLVDMFTSCSRSVFSCRRHILSPNDLASYHVILDSIRQFVRNADGKMRETCSLIVSVPCPVLMQCSEAVFILKMNNSLIYVHSYEK
jgi:hypothetical protein